MADQDIRQKAHRIVSLFSRFICGETIRKVTEAKRFNVTEKTIQRDIDTIREYLASECSIGENREICWSPSLKGYTMLNRSKAWLEKDDVLVIAKVLLESRAFCKLEMDELLEKLLLQVPISERSYIQEAVRNEKFHYVPVKHGKKLIHNLWTLSKAVKEQFRVSICYRKENDGQDVIRIVEPQGIVFSEYYFYLVACICDSSYEFPAIYRIDRIQKMMVLPEHFAVSYCKRFEEGEFRKRVQFMYSGPLLRIRFKFWGKSLDAVMDRLPTARVLESDGKVALIEAEVFGQGIKMWLLSQGDCLEVVAPTAFRDDVKRTVETMLKIYS